MYAQRKQDTKKNNQEKDKVRPSSPWDTRCHSLAQYPPQKAMDDKCMQGGDYDTYDLSLIKDYPMGQKGLPHLMCGRTLTC